MKILIDFFFSSAVTIKETLSGTSAETSTQRLIL
jgi:hypothetical protein